MAKPAEGPDRPFTGEPVAQAGELAAIDGGTRLAQRIWRRYGSAPGVIPGAATLGLARRINRLGRQRLPLLDVMQRRWALAAGAFPHGQARFLHVWSTGVARPLSLSADTVRPAPALAPPHPDGARPASPAALASARRPVVARQADASIRLGRSAFAQPLHQGSNPSLVQGDGVPPPIADNVQHPDEARVVPPSPTRPGDQAVTTLQHRPSGSFPPGEGALRQAAGAGPRSSTTQSEAHRATRPGNLGLRILQRYCSGPAGQILWRQLAGPGPVRPDSRTTADYAQGSGPLVLLPPVASEAPRSLKTRAGIPAVTSAGGLGTSILRRYRGGPAERVLPRQPVLPGPTRAGRLATGSQARTEWPVTTGPSVARLAVPHLSTAAGDAEATGTEAATPTASSLLYAMVTGGTEAVGAERVMRMPAYLATSSHVDMPLVMAAATDRLASRQTQQEPGMLPPTPAAPTAAGIRVAPGTAPTGGAAPSPTAAPEAPDPEQMARQVYVWMRRRLRLERERKGVQQWL
jgi:hypothetical protein